MNIIVSSFMLAIAILMVAHSIGELHHPKAGPKKKPTEPVNTPCRTQARVPADWERILRETELKKAGRRK